VEKNASAFFDFSLFPAVIFYLSSKDGIGDREE